MLLIFRGLPGTGKSYLLQRVLAARPGFLVLSRDVIRLAVVPRPAWSPSEKEMVDELVAAMAGVLLDLGRDVAIDGMSLSSAAGVDRLVQVAVSRGVPFRIIECVCRQDTALARIKFDEGRHPAGDRNPALYFEVKARFQAVAHPVLTVDTDGDADLALGQVLAYVGA